MTEHRAPERPVRRVARASDLVLAGGGGAVDPSRPRDLVDLRAARDPGALDDLPAERDPGALDDSPAPRYPGGDA